MKKKNFENIQACFFNKVLWCFMLWTVWVKVMYWVRILPHGFTIHGSILSLGFLNLSLCGYSSCVRDQDKATNKDELKNWCMHRSHNFLSRLYVILHHRNQNSLQIKCFMTCLLFQCGWKRFLSDRCKFAQLALPEEVHHLHLFIWSKSRWTTAMYINTQTHKGPRICHACFVKYLFIFLGAKCVFNSEPLQNMWKRCSTVILLETRTIKQGIK